MEGKKRKENKWCKGNHLLHPISSQMFRRSPRNVNLGSTSSAMRLFLSIVLYGTESLCQLMPAVLAVSPLSSLPTPSPLTWWGQSEKHRGPWWWASTALYCLLAIAKLLVVINALSVTSLKQKITQATMKKINCFRIGDAVILRKKVWKSLSTIYWIWAVVGCFKNA